MKRPLKEKAVAQRRAFDANCEALEMKTHEACRTNQRVIAGQWFLPQGGTAVITIEPDGTMALFTGNFRGEPVACEPLIPQSREEEED